MKVKEQKKVEALERELEELIMDLGYRRAMCHPRAREIEKLLEKMK